MNTQTPSSTSLSPQARKVLTLLLFLSFLLPASKAFAQDAPYDITVSDQAQFDRLLAYKSANDTSAQLKPGTYYIDDTRQIYEK